VSSFAANHIALKGALFIFSKVSSPDLADDPRDITTLRNSKLDQMFATYLPVEGVTHRPRLSWLDLAGKFLGCATSLPSLMENGCDQNHFPLAICPSVL